MRLRFKIFLIPIALYCLHGVAYAQQPVEIRGVVFKKASSERLSKTLVTDLKSQVVMVSDELGMFKIQAAVGDTLLFTAYKFTPQKIVIVNSYEMAVNMEPIIELNEVVIKGQTKRQELNQVVNTYRAKGIYFDGRPPLKAFSPFGGSPITALYEMFSKDAANEKRFMRYSKNELEATEVDRRYTKSLVKSVTKLPDDEVLKFMQVFTPSYEDLKEWNDYQLISYIKKSLDYFQKNKDKPEAQPQKLY